MPPKFIPKKIMDELRELEIDLADYKPAVICPYCFEVNEEENIAIPVGDTLTTGIVAKGVRIVSQSAVTKKEVL